MNKVKRKILLLEDDELFAHTIIEFLEESNFRVDWVCDGEEALGKSYDNNYDLYLFDINVPKINGIELLQTLRNNDIKTPTIFLTSYKDDKTLKECFENGCDDYLRKPFKIYELLFRINAILKRTSRAIDIIKISLNYHFDFNKREVFYHQEEIKLPLKVIQLIELFIENDNKTVTNDEIIDRLWSSSEEHSYGALRLYISKVRQIMGKEKIKSIKKVGYVLSGIVCD